MSVIRSTALSTRAARDFNAPPNTHSGSGLWRNVDEVEYATLEWVDWFNNHRLLEPIGNVPPGKLEMAYYRQREESAMAA